MLADVSQFSLKIETHMTPDHSWPYDRSLTMKTGPEIARFAQQLCFLDFEKFLILYLDAGYRLIGFREFSGTTNLVNAPLREIVKAAILCNAEYVATAHNHPNMSHLVDDDSLLRFSTCDVDFFKKLSEALHLFSIGTGDDVVISGQLFTSRVMQENALGPIEFYNDWFAPQFNAPLKLPEAWWQTAHRLQFSINRGQ